MSYLRAERTASAANSNGGTFMARGYVQGGAFAPTKIDVIVGWVELIVFNIGNEVFS